MDIQTPLESLLASLLAFLPKLVAAIVIFVAAIILANLVCRWLDKALRQKPNADRTIAALITKVTRALVIIFGALMALEQVEFNITGFIAGLGIAGFTIGFALQDMGRNFVAGIIMLIYRPFGIGDTVKAAEYTGEVIDITLRDTVIRTFDGEKVILPNNNVFNKAIVNYSDLPLRRRTISLSLSPHEEVGKAATIFKNAVAGVDGVLGDPAVVVQFDSIGDHGLLLLVRFWLDQTKSNVLQVHSDAIQAVQDAARDAKINLPSPVQTIQIENDRG